MPKTRTSARYRKRLKVTFDTAISFTIDVSTGGFCIESMRVLPPGAPVRGALFMGSRQVPFAGRVAWARPGHPQINLRGRMGVMFERVSPELRELIEPVAR